MSHSAGPTKPLPARPVMTSRGGVWLAAGFSLLAASSLIAALPGGLWQAYFMSFGFCFFGLIRAKGWARRIAGVALSGVCGGLCLNDFLVWLAQH